MLQNLALFFALNDNQAICRVGLAQRGCNQSMGKDQRCITHIEGLALARYNTSQAT